MSSALRLAGMRTLAWDNLMPHSTYLHLLKGEIECFKEWKLYNLILGTQDFGGWRGWWGGWHSGRSDFQLKRRVVGTKIHRINIYFGLFVPKFNSLNQQRRNRFSWKYSQKPYDREKGELGEPPVNAYKRLSLHRNPIQNQLNWKRVGGPLLPYLTVQSPMEKFLTRRVWNVQQRKGVTELVVMGKPSGNSAPVIIPFVFLIAVCGIIKERIHHWSGYCYTPAVPFKLIKSVWHLELEIKHHFID